MLNDLEKAPKGEVEFDVVFRIDENGILNVSARDKKTGNSRDITINSRSLTDEEVKKMHLDSEKNKDKDALIKIILDAQISFERFCDLVKRRATDKRLKFT
jgi:molecular chaperone DnaK